MAAYSVSAAEKNCQLPGSEGKNQTHSNLVCNECLPYPPARIVGEYMVYKRTMILRRIPRFNSRPLSHEGDTPRRVGISL
ncbi:MAG: hypothetical protein G01um101433_218 [Parcubacteria group bacterium Gr01-1014_33]|nr:MAG: hypothetical protein G01um101433_218 [Parcubacteria group bacterium Gr01-1014_33]